MIVWICTDMEGLGGIDHWDQCYHPEDDAPVYLYGKDQLTAEANAAIAGCFDAGATEVRILDGHGRNKNRGFTEALDPRAQKVFIGSRNPLRWEGLDESVHAVAMIGQHAMAGTLYGFLDHTQSPKHLCRYVLNGQEIGEMSQMAIYAGSFGVPLVYTSGDEALCEETRRLFPHAKTTPTKRGTGWSTCELYPVEEVRAYIRRDIGLALQSVDRSWATQVAPPYTLSIEWAWTELADRWAKNPQVRRPHARVIEWDIMDQREIFSYPPTEIL